MRHTVLILRARQFAIWAHGDQTRKYTGEPYWHHPEAVAFLVSQHLAHNKTGHNDNVIAAAYLHDVLEDTRVTAPILEMVFPTAVVELVQELTDPPRGDMNRAQHKAEIRRQYNYASREAKIIKMADILDNTKDVVDHDPKFAPTYLGEKRALLVSLQGADGGLWDRVWNQLHEQMDRLEAKQA